jgi:hypothetical protein
MVCRMTWVWGIAVELSSNVAVRMPAPLFSTVFHEPWWLDAVTQGDWHEATVTSGGTVVARLPYVIKRVMGVTGITMPPLTHTLGPQLPLIGAERSPHLLEDRGLVTELFEQLPSHDYFAQACDPIMGHALPMYAMGYDSTLAYTLRIPAGLPKDQIWQGFRQAIRRAVRKAEKTFTVHHDLAIDEFCAFYNASIEANHEAHWSKSFVRRANQIKFRLYEACQAHGAACLLAARDDKGELQAAIMPVWGHGVMYYLLTARRPDPVHSGAVNLLVWEALKMAGEKGLTFDFDGFLRPSAVNFLTGFGGQVHNRIVVVKASPAVHIFRAIASRFRR